jgi:hypothetical protein
MANGFEFKLDRHKMSAALQTIRTDQDTSLVLPTSGRAKPDA